MKRLLQLWSLVVVLLGLLGWHPAARPAPPPPAPKVASVSGCVTSIGVRADGVRRYLLVCMVDGRVQRVGSPEGYATHREALAALRAFRTG